MPIIGIALILQIACAVHVIKTGREIYWIYIIMFIPGIGIGIYFFTQILPELGKSSTVYQAKNPLLKTIDPQRELRNRKQQLELANTLENKLKLADECFEANMLNDAIDLYKSCLKGIGEGDSDTMVKLAQAYFVNDEFNQSIDLLNEITKLDPHYTSTDGHLLYARNLEKLKRFDDAIAEYEIASENFPGEEARIRYALLLLELQKNEKAKQVFEEVLKRNRLAPKFYQKKERKWIKIAQSNLSKLQ